MQFRIII